MAEQTISDSLGHEVKISVVKQKPISFAVVQWDGGLNTSVRNVLW